MGPKGTAWLEFLRALCARYHALQALPKGHQGLSVAAGDQKRHCKKRYPGARYAVSSRGLTDLRLLVAWIVKRAPSYPVLGVGLALAAFLACILWLLPLASAYGAAGSVLPFRDSLVFSAAISGSFHKNERRLEHPKFIPRIVHQTAKTLDGLSAEVRAIRQSWARYNPGWEIRFWDDAACRDFVRTEFPEYLTAYLGLPKNVERADFFRYMVVLRHGGVYADIDTECAQPLDDYIKASDTLVVGWEGEVGNDYDFVDRHFARYRQVQQWWFAGAPEHPALRKVCDHIAAHYQHRFQPHANLDTLERTGPGPWTDAVMSTVAEFDARGEGWSVRVLPILSTALHPGAKHAAANAMVATPGVLVAHHFKGTWKAKSGYKTRNLWRRFSNWAQRAGPEGELVPIHPFSSTPEIEHYPVSVNLTGTVFTVMVNLVGHGDFQSREDVSHALTTVGNWQAGMQNTASPRAPAALLGALRKAPKVGAGDGAPAFLDVGAGLGLYSLAAAAHGHRVFASELADRSTALLRDSVIRNGFERLVTVHNVTVGAEDGVACVSPNGADASGWRVEDVQRGFASVQLHDQSEAAGCERHARRVTMGALVPAGTRVGIVRVSAGAWTARVLRGGLPFLAQQRPTAILVELDMHEMARGGDDDMLAVMRELMKLGYQDMGHAGHVCAERFQSMVAALSEDAVRDRLQTDVNDLRQPVWCELDAATLPGVLLRNLRNGQGKQDAMHAAGVEPLLLQLNTTLTAR